MLVVVKIKCMEKVPLQLLRLKPPELRVIASGLLHVIIRVFDCCAPCPVGYPINSLAHTYRHMSRAVVEQMIDVVEVLSKEQVLHSCLAESKHAPHWVH